MEGLLYPLGLFLSLGAAAAIILWLGSKYLSVQENELQKKIREVLPGANCGACGYAGCDDYALQVAEGKAPCNKCIPGGTVVAAKLSAFTGVSAEKIIPMKAVVSCCGSKEARKGLMDYDGIKTCEACNMFFSGRGLCDFACLGFGDCAAVCPQHAISFEDGLAVVDRELCVGCGLCAKACPNSLIHIIPEKQKYMVVCSSPRPGALTRKDCGNGCIGCGKCAKSCRVGAIRMKGHLAQIDPRYCVGCGMCKDVCPVGVIKEL